MRTADAYVLVRRHAGAVSGVDVRASAVEVPAMHTWCTKVAHMSIQLPVMSKAMSCRSHHHLSLNTLKALK